MVCLRRFCTCFVISLICLSQFCVCSGLESEDSLDSDLSVSEDDVYSFRPVVDVEEPLPVTIIEVPPEDPVYDVRPYAGAAPVLVIGDDPPVDPLFYGSGFVTGTDSRLGDVTLYFPINFKNGYLGVDSNGYLFNVSSSSISGYLAGVYNNSVSVSGFSYPRYRDTNSSGSYTYYDLHLTPTQSNMDIATSVVPRKTADELMPYLVVGLMGVIILCFMRRS